jgi:hypothetical protein
MPTSNAMKIFQTILSNGVEGLIMLSYEWQISCAERSEPVRRFQIKGK